MKIWSEIEKCCGCDRTVREIDEERRKSGWNPYEGEEEPDEIDEAREMSEQNELSGQNKPSERNTASDQKEPQEKEPQEKEPQENGLQETMELEKDLRLLQAMYPQAARTLLPSVLEWCDKLEYEGSMMYDQCPDKGSIQSMAKKIYEELADQFPPQEKPKPDEMLIMQMSGRNPNQSGSNLVQDLAQVMLLQEMHHRRCRRRNCARLQPLSGPPMPPPGRPMRPGSPVPLPDRPMPPGRRW